MREVFGAFHRGAVGALGETFPFVSDVVKAFAVQRVQMHCEVLKVVPDVFKRLFDVGQEGKRHIRGGLRLFRGSRFLP
jgi:hypothetical protein